MFEGAVKITEENDARASNLARCAHPWELETKACHSFQSHVGGRVAQSHDQVLKWRPACATRLLSAKARVCVRTKEVDLSPSLTLLALVG